MGSSVPLSSTIPMPMRQLRSTGTSLHPSPASSSLLRPCRVSCAPFQGKQALARVLIICNADGKSGGLSDDADSGKPDIDALASFLSKEAARLRDSIDSAPKASPESASDLYLPQYDEIEEKLFQEVGNGGFAPADFELVQQLGSISVQQNLPGGLSRPTTTVIAYAARYHPRGYPNPVIMLMKEYLPVARPVAANELLLLKHLCGLPEDKYAAAIEPSPSGSPPVIPLVGYFLSAPTDQAADISTDDTIDSLWLVYKWEGLRPLGMFMQEGPPQAMYGLLRSREAAEEEAWYNRKVLLCAIAKSLLSAVDFCHSADVVHGSLSSGSVLLSPWEGYRAGETKVEVKLDSFGFGKWFTYGHSAPAGRQQAAGVSFGPQTDDRALEAGKREDLQASALLLAEAFVCGMAPGLSRGLLKPGTTPEAPAGILNRDGLQRLLFGVFHEDIQQFRDYCRQDPAKYARLVDFLDEGEGAGWGLLGLMLQGNTSALELSQHPFLAPGTMQRSSSGGGKGAGLGGFSLPWSK